MKSGFAQNALQNVLWLLVIFGACFHCPSPRLLPLLVPVNSAGPDSFMKTVGAVSENRSEQRL